MSQSMDLADLQKLVDDEETETYPLGPSIALACLSVLKDCESHCYQEGLEVKRLGGLHVIGTSLHESRRIDNQLHGRAGRQWDPGSTRFMLLSLQINAEKYFFGIRKYLVEFDEVLEVQRKHVYDFRQLILTGDTDSCSQQIFQYMQAVADEIILNNVDPTKILLQELLRKICCNHSSKFMT